MSELGSKDKIKERFKKLKALAERGVGGEKITAQKKIERLLADNNMTESDILEDTPNYYLFSYTYPYRKRLLNQCIYRVLGATNSYDIYKTRGTRNRIGVYCTAAQKIEIELDFEFYSSLFDEELDSLMSAFIAKQDIFPKDAPIVSLNEDEMTEEELKEYEKKTQYMRNIDKKKRASAFIEDKENSR